MWSEADSLCSLRPPPKDPVFIILVALLTVILSIPLFLFVNYLLNSYASNYPGSRGHDDEVVEEEEMARKNHSQKSSAPNITAAELLRNSTASSAFGVELKKGLPAGNTVDYRSINFISQTSYAGKYKQPSDLNFLFVDAFPVVSVKDYRGSLPTNCRLI